MKRLKTDPDFALGITNILFYTGFALLVIGLAVSRLMDHSNIQGILLSAGSCL